MNNHALLTLIRGDTNSMGKVLEIKFHYPPKAEKELKLFNEAKNVLRDYNFQTEIYWALVEEGNFSRFIETVKTIVPDSSLETIPVNSMHGKISFKICLLLPNVQETDKEPLLDKIMRLDIPLNKNAMDYSFTMRKEMAESMGRPLTNAEVRRETRATIARNLSFYSETSNNLPNP
ncbi:MAG: hypothetical protein UX85_C0004G0079 [Candidatus Beckwithbacteria bacterium GW2011_GWB1_47_15]|uniref:Uncharacterized protein n=1 Tax=Candidatus Beckwithbacteria bacterium GW2011_GWB1_47_15 TaxID=1618371 RepID=A0A0G1RVK9_9BACT|nr:MAG: hypothetical protein UY43_C0001G0163 [Candidatus Beckwithbacteria bacterium GW2011_GWC1_49_16]KKU35482.1 MAG: hypothetical protein UX50_C0003G0079 [Candidatus Beckwithbacteria bacterium GW2011_GWA1_46_30]KKU61157.1 MAG: hypothetical protein UX85_C0004G0079 [Candidatus Beckwithbacteria bacterium GW2011_GWB1_47_15]KKU71996.1 MAG: hypothetical protein UX97_C0002G0079 [Candidatus Beckwithbacteria bacterium GW2011_GWA2_47_25]KKW03234.1 MAG: hypothetical protein UY37_C0006G0059 [Candidatus Be